MNHRLKWILWLSLALSFTSACNLLSNLNPFNGIASEIEELADQLPMEDIQEQIDKLSTELPGEINIIATDLPTSLEEITDDVENLTTDLPVDLDAMATDLPSEVDGILSDFDGFLDEALGSEDIPEDIPIIEGEVIDLFGSEKVISYKTALDFDTVLSFYQEQMLQNGWSAKDDSVITADAALLYFEKLEREATVTMSSVDSENRTVVMIIIQDTQ